MATLYDRIGDFQLALEREHKKVSAAFCNFAENASEEIRNEKRIKENCRETFLRIIYALRDFHHVMDVQGGLYVNYVTRFWVRSLLKQWWSMMITSNVITYKLSTHLLPQLHRKSINNCNTNFDMSHKAQLTRGKMPFVVSLRGSIKFDKEENWCLAFFFFKKIVFVTLLFRSSIHLSIQLNGKQQKSFDSPRTELLFPCRHETFSLRSDREFLLLFM